jgi:hypothetical protein
MKLQKGRSNIVGAMGYAAAFASVLNRPTFGFRGSGAPLHNRMYFMTCKKAVGCRQHGKILLVHGAGRGWDVDGLAISHDEEGRRADTAVALTLPFNTLIGSAIVFFVLLVNDTRPCCLERNISHSIERAKTDGGNVSCRDVVVPTTPVQYRH